MNSRMRQGDGPAVLNRVLRYMLHYYKYLFALVIGCILVSAVCTVADPEVVVIGGGVSKAGEVLIEGAKKGFLKYVFYPSADVRFNLAVLGNDAGIYGCCKLLLDSLAR